MANNPYVNKVVYGGQTLIDISDTTATADKILQGYIAYGADGQKITGTANTSGGSGSVWQDENGYIHLSDEGDTPTPVPKKWERPSDWPDLSQMDVSDGDILYMTSYADEARGFCDFYVDCTGSYTVELGSISGTTFTAENTYTYASGNHCQLYYGSANGTYKVLRVTGTDITYFRIYGNSGAITIGSFNGCTNNQGIIDVVGKLPSCTGMYCSNIYNLVNMDIDGIALSGNVSNMFSYCSSLTSLDVSGWDTAKVTNMTNMFQNCYSLTSLDVSGWDTGLVTSMSYMFQNCSSLTSLDVSGWDTATVINMSYMFYYCTSLTSLDVSGWDTATVTNISNMFYYCSSLTSLDVSGWDTAKVTNMSSMFSYCSSLTSLDVSGWDTGLVTRMSYMFQNCYSLTSLDVSGWDTATVINMSNMFSYCSSITSLDVSEWGTGLVTNMSAMFQNCYSLMSLDVSGWDTAKVTNMASMFQNCYSLTSLDVSGWDTAKVTTSSNTGGVFRYCRGLHGSLILPSSLTQIGTYCFADTRSITEYHFLSTTPPTLSNTNAFNNMDDFGGKKIYVPAASLSAYQTASNWSTYASYMVGE